MTCGSLKVAIVGFGTVGQGFFDLFNRKKNILGLEDVTISEIMDRGYGHIVNPPANLTARPEERTGSEKSDWVKIIEESDADILCEFSVADFRSAEPATSHIKAALRSGKNVITTNKGPMALHYGELMGLSKSSGKMLKFKGTVMAGTPSFNVMSLLPGAGIRSVRGIFNGTTNFMLSRMDEGASFDQALGEAKEKGYAESDPTNDIEGYDAGAKVAIISSFFGWDRIFSDVEIEGLSRLMKQSDRSGYKLIGYADQYKAYVRPEKLEKSDLLCHVNGVTNAIEVDTETLGKVMVTGPGAGRTETAQAALTDLVDIIRR